MRGGGRDGWAGKSDVFEGDGKPGLQDALTMRIGGYRGELQIQSAEDHIQTGREGRRRGGGDTIDHVFLNDEKRS